MSSTARSVLFLLRAPFPRSTGAGLVPLAPSTIWRLALILPSWIVQTTGRCAAPTSKVLSPRATGPFISSRRTNC